MSDARRSIFRTAALERRAARRDDGPTADPFASLARPRTVGMLWSLLVALLLVVGCMAAMRVVTHDATTGKVATRSLFSLFLNAESGE